MTTEQVSDELSGPTDGTGVTESSDSDAAQVSVTMLGSLSPWKAITPYCREIFDGLEATDGSVQFINWRNLYPRRFYPGGNPHDGSEFPTDPNVLNILTWWNPLTWMIAGLRVEGDVVHAQWWSFPLMPVYFTVLLFARIRGKPVVLTIHNVKPHEESRVNNLLNRLVFFTANRYLVHSEENKRALCSQYGIPPHRVTAVPHPVLTSVPKHGLSRAQAKRELGIGPDRDVLLAFGGIRDYKGLDILLERLPALVDANPDVLLVVAGACWDDWDKYAEIIRAEQLEDHVRTDIGYVADDDIESYFAAASVTVFPYKYFDAQSGVASLSRYFDRYSIGFDRGGLRDQLSETVESPEALVSRLTELLDGSPPSLHVENTASMNERCIQAHNEVYRAMLGR